MTNDGLTTETIDRRAERLIEIHSREQARIILHAVDARAKHNSLHDVAGAQVPNLAGEHDVVRAVHL